ncbi:hypothetical protein HDZ31DRAFT_37479 [Schizophyllum fasciatum]
MVPAHSEGDSSHLDPHIKLLLLWCAHEGIKIDHRLRLVNKSFGMSFSSIQREILPNETVVIIPRNVVLSTRNCTLKDEIVKRMPTDWAYNHLNLAFVLYTEILLGCESRWHGYLQALPESGPDLPMFWNISSGSFYSEDGANACRWLQGTEFRALSPQLLTCMSVPQEAIERYYEEVVAPLCTISRARWSVTPTFKGFTRAYALVCSRAFVTDLYYGPCMVPIADAFNHHAQNHVQLAVEHSVCPQCGSIEACSHDQNYTQNPLFNVPSGDTGAAAEGTFDMVTTTYVAPMTEVFNTYGDTLSNAELLASYGFLLDQNDNDHLSCAITDSELLGSGPDSDALRALYQNMVPDLPPEALRLLEDSELVERNDRAPPFSINGEGKISYHLWLLLALQSLLQSLSSDSAHIPEPTTTEAIVARLPALAKTQIIMEALAEDKVMVDVDDPNLDEMAIRIPRLVIALCQRRRRRYFREGTHTLEELGLELDNVPEAWSRSRLALTLLIGERAILDSCEASWAELGALVDPAPL